MTTRLWSLIQQWLDAQFFRVTQSQLADKLGVTRSAVSQWKHGQARPTPANLRDIAELTRIPYVDLRTALVEDLGYLVEEVGSDVRSAPNTHAGESPADEVMLHVDPGEPIELPEKEASERRRPPGRPGRETRV